MAQRMERELYVYLYGSQDGVCLADDADDDRSLLDGFLGIFDLEDTTLRRAGREARVSKGEKVQI
jgi:hypothetical protein